MGILASVKHIARLRSWRENRRTAAFCIVSEANLSYIHYSHIQAYYAAWAADLLIPLLSIVLIASVISPSARKALFPPAPLAIVDYKTGGVTKPLAGVLGSTNSATGAPENQKGEAVENEASNFVTSFGAIGMNIATGKDPKVEEETKGGSTSVSIPESNSLATTMAVAKDKASGVDRPSQDKTKVPMETTMWAGIEPLMAAVIAITDTWERFAKLVFTSFMPIVC